MSRRREREKQKTRWHGSQRDWMDIAISGCGISGLVTALALARGGHKVTIFERDSDPNFELQGFHYYWPTDPDVTYALKRLGIWDVVHELKLMLFYSNEKNILLRIKFSNHVFKSYINNLKTQTPRREIASLSCRKLSSVNGNE